MRNNLEKHLLLSSETYDFSTSKLTFGESSVGVLLFNKQEELDSFLKNNSQILWDLGYFSFQAEEDPSITIDEIVRYFEEFSEMPTLPRNLKVHLYSKDGQDAACFPGEYLDSFSERMEECLRRIQSISDFGYLYISGDAIKGLLYKKLSELELGEIHQEIHLCAREVYNWDSDSNCLGHSVGGLIEFYLGDV